MKINIYKPITIALILTILGLFTLASCYRCGCNCKEYNGCVIIQQKFKFSNKLFKSDTFCIQNGYSSKELADTIDKYSFYSTDTSYAFRIDSLKTIQRISKIDCDDVEIYRQKGFDCMCAK